MATVDGSQIFALIVGINNYNSNEIHCLSGAVGDATRFKNHLHDTLGVPESNVKLLTDENATRAAILDLFDYHLLNNLNIQKEKNPILILYFAGHGGRVPAPKNWMTTDGNIETICPVDDFTRDADGNMIVGIPDITLNIKLDQLATNKGDNIVVILDCCHSGGAARGPRSLPDNVRVRLGVVDYGEKVDFPDDEKSSWEAAHAPRDSKYRRPHRSYVLLAACQDVEYAHETEGLGIEEEQSDRQYSGIFTTALLKYLKQYNPTSYSLTYLDLIESVRAELSSVQCPTCYGFNKDRWLFRSEARSQLHAEPVFILENFKGTSWDCVIRDHCFTIGGQDNSTPCYQLVADETSSVLKYEQYPNDSAIFGDIDIDRLKITPRRPPNIGYCAFRRINLKLQKHFLKVNPAFIIRVGGMHGVRDDSRFTIPLDKDSPPAELKVYRIEPQRSTLVFKDNKSVSYKQISTTAKVSWIADLSSAVRVHLEGPGLEHVIESSHFTLVDHDDADVVVSFHTKEGSHLLRVKRFDPLILQLIGTTRDQDFDEVHMDVEDVADIPAIVDHIARFHYYLGCTFSKDRIKALGPPDKITLHLHKLVTKNGIRIPQNNEDHFVGRYVDLNTPFGIEISKHSDGCVYLSLFSFDPRTYKIELCVQSNDMNDCLLGSSRVTNFLTSDITNGRKQFTVGYGPGGGDPFYFEPGERLFFKLFASGNYCDWSFIQQGDVSGVRRGLKRPQEEIDFKGAWVVGAVGKE